MGAQRIGMCRHAFAEQRADFINQAISEVRLSARIDSSVQFFPRWIECEHFDSVSKFGRLFTHWPLRRNAFTGLKIELDCPLDARPITLGQFTGFLRVKLFQDCVEM